MSSTVTNYSNNINVLYPIPGVDNDTQGFRDNFSSIKNALQATAQELSNLNLNTSKLNTGTNDYNYSSTIYRAPIKASGYVVTNEETVSSATSVNYLLGSYRKFSVNENALFSFTGWKNGIYSELFLEIKNFSSETTASFSLSVPNLKTPIGLTLPFVLNTTTNTDPVVFKVWSSDGGNTVFFDKVLDTDTNLTPFLYNPETFDSDVAVAQYANSSTTASFALTVLGNNQPNITGLGVLNTLTIGSAVFKYDNNNLIISGIGGLTIASNSTISRTLTDWSGGSGSLTNLSTLTFTSVEGISLGDTFKLYSTETSVHVVKSIDSNTNKITTDAFNAAGAALLGVGDGSGITFNKGLLYNSVYYSASAPTFTYGKEGDKRGGIFANTSSLFVAFRDHENNLTQSWTEFLSKPVVENYVNSLTNQINNLSSSTTDSLNVLSTSSLRFASSAPLTSAGSLGDKKGTIFANTNTLYICYSDYIGGTSPIWARVATVNSW
jgi:hypothetical protein